MTPEPDTILPPESSAPAEPATLPSTPRTTADQLLLDLSTIWRDRYARTQQGPASPWFETGELWRAQAAGIVDAFAALYLLATLRDVAPDAAERAAEFLRTGANVAAERMPGLVEDWAAAVAAGRPLTELLP